MNKLFDLRFMIGSFFTIVGAMLLIYGVVGSGEANSVNVWSGAVFLVFGIIMVVLSFGKDANDEILEE